MNLSEKEIGYMLSLNGWCDAEKMNRLFELVIDRKDAEPLIIVELGVFAGRSLFPMALACKKLGKGLCYGYDAWDNKTAFEGEEISKENSDWWNKVNMPHILDCFKKSIQFLLLHNQINWDKKRSQEAAASFEDDSVSILHQDSGHNTSTIISELQVWCPKIKIGGYWVVDDINWESTKEGYAKLPEYGFELVKQYESWAIYIKVK
jgi:hypothetical protein